jgi:hypothetical protein
LCALTALKETRFDLIWSCFAASNGPCKAVIVYHAQWIWGVPALEYWQTERDLGLISQQESRYTRADRGGWGCLDRADSRSEYRQTGRADKRVRPDRVDRVRSGEAGYCHLARQRVALPLVYSLPGTSPSRLDYSD